MKVLLEFGQEIKLDGLACSKIQSDDGEAGQVWKCAVPGGAMGDGARKIWMIHNTLHKHVETKRENDCGNDMTFWQRGMIHT